MIIEYIVMCVIGTLLHFTYDFTNHNKVVGLFSAVNESTWEHIKMALSAFFLCSIVDGFYLGSNPNYFVAKFFAASSIIIVMPLIFYGYTSISKKPILLIDISSFFITIAVSMYVFNYFINLSEIIYSLRYICLLGFFFIFGFYMVVTLFPFKNFLFKDPITKEYGLDAHKK